MRRAIILAAACPFAAVALAGCAGPRPDENRGEASSLVYSPSARLPQRDPTAGGASDATTPGTATVEDTVRPPAGRACKVHLRREALGIAGQMPYALRGNNIAADRVQVSGTLERVGSDWLVLRSDRSTYWIPRDAVLAVEFEEK